jgi:hypothetical protein
MNFNYFLAGKLLFFALSLGLFYDKLCLLSFSSG